MLFSKIIRQLRIDSGKRQKDIADAIGVDVPAYSRYEHGERRPRRKQVLQLARIFNTDADELVAAWLADEAYYQIATDKMAPRAAALLHEMMTGEEHDMPVTPPVKPVTQPPKAVTVASEPDPTVKRDMIARMGGKAMPVLVQGDAATVMQRIEDHSIDCIVTTPPYWRRRNQGTESITATSADAFIQELLQTLLSHPHCSDSQHHQAIPPVPNP